MRFVDRVMFRQLFLFICLGACLLSVQGQSVLATGNWYKVGITKSGVYKLDRTFLSNLGLPVSSLDPRTLKVYGNGGGGILPQLNSVDRPFDLQENAIQEVGNANGTFDTNEYFLFYGQSPDKLTWNASGFSYEKNIYSDTTYYFITYGGATGARIQTVASEAEQPDIITTYDDVLIHENDQRNRLSSGRRWLGESLSPATALTANFTFNSSNVTALNRASLHAVGESDQACSITMTVNGQLVGTLPIGALPGGDYTSVGIPASGTYPITGASNSINVQLTFQNGDGLSIGYVDWFSIEVTRTLAYQNEPLHFRSKESLENSISSFRITNAPSTLTIWDVTNPIQPAHVAHSLAAGAATFSTSTTDMKEFVALAGSTFSSPVPFGRVPNQSIKSTTAVEGIIIVHPTFLEQARRLADFHASYSNLSVAVVTTRQVYNEFSSGRQDVSALRDYARYVYQTGGMLKYLLLFGDASYDFKNRSEPYNNFVPVYESYESFHPIFSYSSDDYFGFFEEDEGAWEENLAGDHTMEIGVGRLPVKTAAEAKIVVDKIIRYVSNPSTFGPWRNKVVYVADDGDGNIHQNHAESLSDVVLNGTGQNVQKIYLDAYDQVIYPSYEESPVVSRELVKSIENGALLFNYIGHGSEFQWMDEKVLTGSEIFRLRNYQKLPIFVTATCQFGRYDDSGNSGAEDLILGEQGAIALLTTTRLVYAHTNFFLNQAFHVGWVNAASDPTRRLGDILRDTKNNGLQGPVNRNFALLGDPMMRPAFPAYDITIDQLASEEAVTWSALQRVTLTGNIRQDGEIVPNFSGKINATLFDIPVEKITKGQQSSTMIFREQDNALYRGEATVTNGAFTLDFIVPKNISYQNLEGRLSLYAWDNTLKQDAGAMMENLVLGGTDKTAPDDNTPPSLRVYLNEPGFRNGGTVGPGAVLIARFEDESGMNISNSGFDRGITMELNGQLIELNSYYTTETDTYERGAVVYPLNDLDPGHYTAVIKGSDVYNNPVSKSVDFVVSNQPILQTFNLKTYPNPAQTLVNFSFDHDREGESLVLDLVIYSMNGDVAFAQKSLVAFSARSVLHSVDLTGKLPRDGMYVFRLAVKSTADGALRELTGRLVIGN